MNDVHRLVGWASCERKKILLNCSELLSFNNGKLGKNVDKKMHKFWNMVSVVFPAGVYTLCVHMWNERMVRNASKHYSGVIN